MHKDVFFDNQIHSAKDTFLKGLSMAALYGKGIFTTVAIFENKPYLWKKHWQRLADNAANLGLDLAHHSEESTLAALNSILRNNEVSAGRARLTFFDGSASDIWSADIQATTNLLITTGDPRPVPDNLRLGISPYTINSRSPLAGVKSCNYLENLMAQTQAKQRGFNEAIRLNENGKVASACMANVFWLKGERLFTPSLDTGCLAGTTREFVIENHECSQVAVNMEELRRADAIFLTSAGVGIAAADAVDGAALKPMPSWISNLIP